MAEHDLQSIAFPTLDEAQMTRLSGCAAARVKSFQEGQTLFAVGDRDMKFFVVKSGEVAIIDLSGDEPKQLVVHRKGQFTGEICHLTGASAVVSACRPRPLRGDWKFRGDALRPPPEPMPGSERHHSSGGSSPAGSFCNSLPTSRDCG